MTEAEDLIAIAQSDAPLEDRERAGEALASLGDPRAVLVDMVTIPRGLLKRARGEATTELGVSLEVEVSAFAVDRYPVTVAAFARFVDEEGYAREELWSEAGWAWRRREAIDRPRFWGEPEWAAYLVPNHPVVGVSFYEAEAFATFRGARLPTEAEWERACRGGDGRCYPWGAEWRDDACAMRGVGPRRTLPIGTFAQGESPFGVRDMVGCVWQWCRDIASPDALDRSPVDPCATASDDGEDVQRITRGGAWNTLQWSVHCTARNGYPPTARFSNLGFRCVKSA